MRSKESTQPRRGRSTLAFSTAVMASGTLVSRLLGLVRNALLVAVVGALGFMADSWSVANKLPNIISMLLAGGILNAVLVPQVVRAMRRRDGGEEHVNRLLTVAIAVLLGVTVVLTAAASLLITVYANSFSAEWKAVAVALAYWCIPQLFFYGLYTLLGQVLNARSNFGPYMWAPALNNVIAIAGLVAFLVIFGGFGDGGSSATTWTGDRITLLAGSATAGVVAQALVLIIPLYRSGFRFRPVWGLRGHGLGKTSAVAMWAFAALAVGQLGYLVVSNVAAAASTAAHETGAPIAGNLAYDNAFLIFMLPQSLVTVSLVTALFTRVSHNAAARDGAKVRDDLSFGLRALGIFTILAAAAFSVLAIPLVQLVTLDRAPGGFADYRAIGAILVAMSFGLVSIAIWTMVQRVFYAYEDTRTLFRLQVPMAAILALGSLLGWWLLEPQWWVVGIGVATTLSNTVGAFVGYLATRKYLPSLDGARVLRSHLRALLAIIPPAFATWGLLHLWGVQTSFWGAFVRVLVLGAFLVAFYLVLLRALRVQELDALLSRVQGPLHALLRRLPGRRSAALSTMSEAEGIPGRGVQTVTTTSSVTLSGGALLDGRFRLDEPRTAVVDDSQLWDGTDLALGAPVRIMLVAGPHRDHTVDAARRAALIDDYRLPRVLRAGVEADQGFIATEASPGVTLAQLAAAGPLPPSQARTLVGEAAIALETARRRGVHHLALRPRSLMRTDDGQVRLLDLGTGGAVTGEATPDAAESARQDAVGLVHLLYAGLTGTWPGDPDWADGLPLAERHGEAVVPAGDVVSGIPNDLDTLCAVTMGEHDDGPFTPGELVADLAPWGPIDMSVPAAPLPPVVQPEPAAAQAPTAESTPAGPDAPTGQMAAVVPPATSPDTSRWAPHPPPAVPVVPTPFSDLLTTTGVLPAALPARHERHDEVSVSTGTAAVGHDEDFEALTQTRVREIGEPVVGEPATSEAAEDPDLEALTMTRRREPGEPIEAEPAAPPIEAVSLEGLPVLAQTARGWDAPGGAGPDVLPAPVADPAESAGLEPDLWVEPEAEPEPAQGDRRRSVLSAITAPIRATNRKINEVGDKVGAGTRSLVDGAGERLGSITERAGSYVDDVRGEFEPLPHEDDRGRPAFNPAPITLVVCVALVIFALVMAIFTLKDAASSFTPGPNPGEVPPSATASEEPTEEPSDEPTPTDEDSSDGAPAASSVDIEEGVTYDPTVSGGENQGDAYLAYDGNPDTTWNSLRYNSPTYGMKPGLGYTVVLERTARISSVTLDVAGEGGRVEIRVGDPSAPETGEVLASGSMGSQVTYEFDEPIEADAISLWFPELPVADSDGRNRIELAEITLD